MPACLGDDHRASLSSPKAGSTIENPGSDEITVNVGYFSSSDIVLFLQLGPELAIE
jgi:hypothetical protein